MNEHPSRRVFLGAGALLATAAAGCGRDPGEATAAAIPPSRHNTGDPRWADVRALFPLTDEVVHLSALLIASHPKPVADAIAGFRAALDRDPTRYVEANNEPNQRKAIEAAAGYAGADARHVALTDSTTMGLALIYNGLTLQPGDEVLTTNQDYFVTHESLRLAAGRSGATIRRIDLYDEIAEVSGAGMTSRIAASITPSTRVIALTWVHSSTGLKIPARAIGDMIASENASRAGDRQILFCLDGVHGFANQDVDVSEIGCDFFAAGCHKWLFGPRGTGIVIGSDRGWDSVTPTIPSFIDDAVWGGWLQQRPPGGSGSGRRFTPGGFKAFEHMWALPAAFAMHAEIGRADIAARTAQLARRAKEGLDAMKHVRLITPMDETLSAGIVSFDVERLSAETAASRLKAQGIIASAAPYAVQHTRLTPCIYNSEADIDRALEAIDGLA